MSIGTGYALSGWMQGDEQRRQRGRQQVQDQQRTEAHNLGMQSTRQNMAHQSAMQPLRQQQAELGIEHKQQQMGQADTTFEQSQQLWQQQQDEARQQEALNQALARFEIGNDPSQLFQVGQQLGVIEQPPEQVEGGWKINGNVYGKEDLMGLGASLMQPGALTQVQQARAQAQAEAQQQQMEARRGEVQHNQVTMPNGALGVVITGPDGQPQTIPVNNAQTGQPTFLRQDGGDEGPKTAEFNSAHNVIRTLFGYDQDGFQLNNDISTKANMAGKISGRAIEKGMNPLEAGYFGYSVANGMVSPEEAQDLVRNEISEQEFEQTEEGKSGMAYETYVQQRGSQIYDQFIQSVERADSLGLIDEDIKAQIDLQSGPSTASNDPMGIRGNL